MASASKVPDRARGLTDKTEGIQPVRAEYSGPRENFRTSSTWWWDHPRKKQPSQGVVTLLPTWRAGSGVRPKHTDRVQPCRTDNRDNARQQRHRDHQRGSSKICPGIDRRDTEQEALNRWRSARGDEHTDAEAGDREPRRFRGSPSRQY
jgi:hypothetical protein